VAGRAESQDICFVPRGDLESYLRQMMPEMVRPGPIEDLAGRVIGEHRGIGLYTVGQRSGLGLSRPRPTYVIAIDAARNALRVGDDADLFSGDLAASDIKWIAGAPPAETFRADAKIRYAAEPQPCSVSLVESGLRLTFDEPQRAIAPGQSVVLYDGDVVLGGGRIDG
jgi:tRNA-specific 2-thiouridylase